MNKYKEALKNIKHSLFVNGAMGYAEEIKMIEELIEKATPKKTIIQDRTPYHEFCSVCGGLVFDSHNYCCKCGQALDWSNEE